MLTLKFLEKEKQAKPKDCTKKELIKIKEKTNATEINTMQKSMNKSSFFERLNKIGKLPANFIKKGKT